MAVALGTQEAARADLLSQQQLLSEPPALPARGLQAWPGGQLVEPGEEHAHPPRRWVRAGPAQSCRSPVPRLRGSQPSPLRLWGQQLLL